VIWPSWLPCHELGWRTLMPSQPAMQNDSDKNDIAAMLMIDPFFR
jgi:hypothetical protein